MNSIEENQFYLTTMNTTYFKNIYCRGETSFAPKKSSFEMIATELGFRQIATVYHH